MRHATSNGLFAVRFYVLAAGLGIGLGAATLVGGEARFSEPSYSGPAGLVLWTGIPAHWVWGAIFLTYGIILVLAFGRHTTSIHALRFGVVLYFFLAVSFVGSAALDARASLTGIIVYTVFAMAHAFLSDHFHSRGWEG